MRLLFKIDRENKTSHPVKYPNKDESKNGEIHSFISVRMTKYLPARNTNKGKKININ